jgi:hypothetical protein
MSGKSGSSKKIRANRFTFFWIEVSITIVGLFRFGNQLVTYPYSEAAKGNRVSAEPSVHRIPRCPNIPERRSVMKRAFLVLAILALAASGALGAAFPTLTLYNGNTLTQSDTDIHLTATPLQLFGGAAGSATERGYGNDYTLTATLHWTQTTAALGLLERGNFDTFQLYEASMNPADKYLSLVKVDGGLSGIHNLATYKYDAFDPANDYKMTLTAKGSALTASLYQMDGTLIQTLSATDSSFATGMVGVQGLVNAAPGVDGHFFNATITDAPPAAPEPGTIAMLIAATFALLGWTRLRARR